MSEAKIKEMAQALKQAPQKEEEHSFAYYCANCPLKKAKDEEYKPK